MNRILRRNEVERITSLSRATIYRLIKKDMFPKPITLGLRSVGWQESEIHNWLAKKIESRAN